MSVALLKSRVAKLEAAKRSPAKARGFIGGDYGHLVPDPNKPGHLMFSQPPGGFAEFARVQQATLQAQLRELFADEDAPQPDAPAYVGTVNDQTAPWPENRKRPKYVEVEVAGKNVEIEIATFKGFAR